MYDFWNFAGDADTTISYRDDKAALSWWYTTTANKEDLQVENFNIMLECGSKTTTDLWDSIGVEMDWNGLIQGTITPAQMQETYKQQYQDAIDNYLGN